MKYHYMFMIIGFLAMVVGTIGSMDAPVVETACFDRYGAEIVGLVCEKTDYGYFGMAIGIGLSVFMGGFFAMFIDGVQSI